MNPRGFERPFVPSGRAVFLIGGERDQDDAELFQELWRKHCEAEKDRLAASLGPAAGQSGHPRKLPCASGETLPEPVSA